jgi:hypothetical protein
VTSGEADVPPWQPALRETDRAQITAFRKQAEERAGRALRTYAELQVVRARAGGLRAARLGYIPRTRKGKITELAGREVVTDRPVKNMEALADPEALEHFRGREEGSN